MASDIETDIANLLQTGGFGTVGTDIFVFEDMPSDPDQMIWVEKTGSFSEDTPRLEFNLTQPMFRISVRDRIGFRKECASKASLIKDYMRGITNYDTGLGTQIVGIVHISGATNRGIDVKMRPVFVSEFRSFYTYI